MLRPLATRHRDMIPPARAVSVEDGAVAMREEKATHFVLYCRLLDGQEQMTARFERHQPSARDVGCRELGIVVELQQIVLGVKDQRGRADPRDPAVPLDYRMARRESVGPTDSCGR
jgi:hypothetical protein